VKSLQIIITIFILLLILLTGLGLLSNFFEKMGIHNEEIKPFFKNLEVPVGYTQEGKPIFEQKVMEN